MTVTLDQDVIDLLNDPATVKVLATVDGDGAPHAAIKRSLHLAGDGKLHFRELIESSATNRNLVRALWFDRAVSILLYAPDGRSVLIKGRPVKTHITGPLFQRHYQEVRARLGDVDLAAVWVIVPVSVSDQRVALRGEPPRMRCTRASSTSTGWR